MHSTEDRQERGKREGRAWELRTRDTALGRSSQTSVRRREGKGQRRSLGKARCVREVRRGCCKLPLWRLPRQTHSGTPTALAVVWGFQGARRSATEPLLTRLTDLVLPTGSPHREGVQYYLRKEEKKKRRREGGGRGPSALLGEQRGSAVSSSRA